MSEVVPGLFLGNASAAMFPEVARYDVLVNVTREVPFSAEISKGGGGVTPPVVTVQMPTVLVNPVMVLG